MSLSHEANAFLAFRKIQRIARDAYLARSTNAGRETLTLFWRQGTMRADLFIDADQNRDREEYPDAFVIAEMLRQLLPQFRAMVDAPHMIMGPVPRPRVVLVESPYAGDVEANVTYARRAARDCFMRGEFPFLSHLLYTQPGILDDGDPEERALGIMAGLAWGTFADATIVYTDRGISKGMALGIESAHKNGRPVEYRQIGT